MQNGDLMCGDERHTRGVAVRRDLAVGALLLAFATTGCDGISTAPPDVIVKPAEPIETIDDAADADADPSDS